MLWALLSCKITSLIAGHHCGLDLLQLPLLAETDIRVSVREGTLPGHSDRPSGGQRCGG